MQKQKLNLSELKVKSFVASVDLMNATKVKGGDPLASKINCSYIDNCITGMGCTNIPGIC